MTLIWITLAFLAGVVFWHWVGNYFVRKLGWSSNLRADVIGKLSTDTLVALRRDAGKELDRRVRVTDAG
jgi:hypothetical protein